MGDSYDDYCDLVDRMGDGADDEARRQQFLDELEAQRRGG